MLFDMKVYELVHCYDNGESYEDRIIHEDHFLYSTLEKAVAVYDGKTQDESYEGSWSVFERTLDDDECNGICMVHSKYMPCSSIDAEWWCEQQEEELKQEAELQAYWDEIEYAFKEAAGLTYFGIEDWDSDWDTENREKQITRLAHELADRHEHLSIFDWANLVYPFYQMYELSSDERQLFTQEYHSQHYFRYGYV